MPWYSLPERRLLHTMTSRPSGHSSLASALAATAWREAECSPHVTTSSDDDEDDDEQADKSLAPLMNFEERSPQRTLSRTKRMSARATLPKAALRLASQAAARETRAARLLQVDELLVKIGCVREKQQQLLCDLAAAANQAAAQSTPPSPRHLIVPLLGVAGKDATSDFELEHALRARIEQLRDAGDALSKRMVHNAAEHARAAAKGTPMADSRLQCSCGAC